MARLTAKQALRDVLAAGWRSDALAVSTAVQALMDNGYDEQAARRAVDAALREFQILGVN
jgi:Holliday junction resolvasome RuvABC DNA-binding subunit